MCHRLLITLFVVFGLSGLLYAQVDTLKTTPPDTVREVVNDTVAAPMANAVQDTVSSTSGNKERKKYDKFKIGAGISTGVLNTDTRSYNSDGRIGYLFSVSYQRGRFFYWELGVDYNNTRVELKDLQSGGPEIQSEFSVSSIDIPVSVGINILSVTDRIVGLRAFAGATPSFILDVGDNDLDISKSNTNTFNAYGHVGLGVNVLFLYLEAIYKYGFTDFFEELDSNPQQVQLKLGFRF